MSNPTLRRVLLANAGFSFVSAIILMVDGAAIAPFLGEVPAWIYQLVGAGLLLFALDVAFIATRKPPRPAWVKAVIAADASWVIASLVVLVFFNNILTPVGNLVIALAAAAVSVFAIMQNRALHSKESHYPQTPEYL